MKLDQGPDTITIHGSTYAPWTHCGPGRVGTELGKSLPHMAHSLTGLWAPRLLLVVVTGQEPQQLQGWIFPSPVTALLSEALSEECSHIPYKLWYSWV